MWQAENEPVFTVGTRRDPLGISAWRNIAHRIVISSRAPVHSALVQKSGATITNVAGRLSVFDARESGSDSQEAGCKKMAAGVLPASSRKSYAGENCARSDLDFLA